MVDAAHPHALRATVGQVDLRPSQGPAATRDRRGLSHRLAWVAIVARYEVSARTPRDQIPASLRGSIATETPGDPETDPERRRIGHAELGTPAFDRVAR